MKFSKSLIATLITLTLIISSSFAMGEDTVSGYVKRSDSTNWKTSAGDCWRTNLDDSTIKDTDCGYPAPVEAKKTVAPPPPPVKPAPQRITIEASVLFEFDSAELKDEGKAVISEEIKRHKGKVATDAALSITGHTDSIGTREYNQQLSEQRAASIAQYIKQNTSLADHEITISGKGEDQPIASNDTPEGRSQNRRVELYFTGQAQ